MFLLILCSKSNRKSQIFALHSTMFLLIPPCMNERAVCSRSLHSTMFLLIRDLFFTCFNVFQSLHSTMFLLILTTISLSDAWRKIFTFHNVSINTENGNEYPTLFFRFTFHNVSINTSDIFEVFCTPVILYIPQCFY